MSTVPQSAIDSWGHTQPPMPPPPPSGAVNGLTTADRAHIRARCIEAAARICVVRHDPLGPGPVDQLIAVARELEAYVTGEDDGALEDAAARDGREVTP